MAFTWYFSIAIALSANTIGCSRIDISALQMHLGTAGVAQNTSHEISTKASGFDCEFRGKDYMPEVLCNRIRSAHTDKEDCGFKSKAMKDNLEGEGCEDLCNKVRKAVAKEPDSNCDAIARQVHAYATMPAGSKGQSLPRPEPLRSVEFESLPARMSVPVPGSTNKAPQQKRPMVAVPDHGSAGACHKVWVIIEGDNDNLNIRDGSMQFARLMREDLGWDASCAIVLVNSAENTDGGEFSICSSGAICVESSRMEFGKLPGKIGEKFPEVEKIFLMFNDHGDPISGLVFPRNEYLRRPFFQAAVKKILKLPTVRSMFVLVDACFSGSMFGDVQVEIKDAAGKNVSKRASHGPDANTNFPDHMRQMGEEVGKDIMAFASSIPQLACMESGKRGGFFSWSYFNALDLLLRRYLETKEDFTFGNIIDNTWEQMPPLLPRGVEALTYEYTDPATQHRRTQRQPASIRGSAQTFFPMSFGTMSGKSAVDFFCAGLEGTSSSSCDLTTRHPLTSRCESEGAASGEACLALNRLPGDRGFAPLTKQCLWSNEYKLCLPWIKAHAYTDKFAGGSTKDKSVVKCNGGKCSRK